MNIFNSLGSNYNLGYVWKSLFSDYSGSSLKLKNFLEEKYGGRAILTYKGREALTIALKILNLPKESFVAINGFTCFAVYRAIEEAGLNPVCLDLERGSNLNFTPATLEKMLEENKHIKAVVIQNTFGSSSDIEDIKKIAKRENIFLIEDIAHCVGARYGNSQEMGTVGDFTTLTFSQDKIIDAVSGGAVIIRNKNYQNYKNNFVFDVPKHQIKDRLYPLFTYKIRFLYQTGLGKILHFILKKLNLLSKPMEEGLYKLYSLPDWYCNLVLSEFNKLNRQLNHRREIAEIYAEKINKKILNSKITKTLFSSSNLRFPIFVKNRKSLIAFLKKRGIFVSDIWYFDVAPECPNAVGISHEILNLPTHINVTKEDALKIAEKVNLWIKLQ